jgi:phytoene dehydrogenase-like protein
MSSSPEYDAIVVGSGPNGLTAAVTLARSGWSVLAVEAKDTIGGGCRTTELTLPGYRHDVCAAIHTTGRLSPVFRQLPLSDYGLEWVYSPAEVAHPFDGGRAVVAERSIEATASQLGPDADAYLKLISPFARRHEEIIIDIFAGFHLPPHHPLIAAWFGLPSLLPAETLARLRFKGELAAGYFAGMAGHAILPLNTLGTAGVGLMFLILLHAVGWPMAKGGSQAIVDALADYLKSMGGVIRTGFEVTQLEELPAARTVLFDTTPWQLVKIMGERLPSSYRRRLESFRHGPGVFKVDYALDGPIPWAAEGVGRAATVHLGGSLVEIAAAEKAVAEGKIADKPFVLLVQQSQFDSTRSPEGKYTAWAYCHVPFGCTVDVSQQLESQIERYAPGFRDLVLARYIHSPANMESYNPNYIGGDITGGAMNLGQMFTRPTAATYRTPVKGIYLCSASTPPGPGVHGMCGYNAALAALHDFGSSRG